MKTKITTLIIITILTILAGCMIYRVMRGQLKIQQAQHQKAIELYPDIAKFYK